MSFPTAPAASVRTLGLWSTILCTVFSLAYIIAQLAEWAGVLGSAGGPHSRSTTFGLAVPVSRAADVLAAAHLGRRAVGDHLPGGDLAARPPLWPHACALKAT